MTNIFLSWWWNIEQSKIFDSIFYQYLSWRNILYIPRALYDWRYNLALERINNIFPTSQWYTVTLLNQNDNISNLIIDNFDWLYIWWGNTFRLLKLIKESWFNNIIQQFIQSNKPIYWWSAWAIIFWKDINTSADRNITKLWFNQTKWFNSFDWYSICCHYNEKLNTEITDYIHNYNIPVIALPEWVGIHKFNNNTIVWWIGSVSIFTKNTKRIIETGNKIIL